MKMRKHPVAQVAVVKEDSGGKWVAYRAVTGETLTRPSVTASGAIGLTALRIAKIVNRFGEVRIVDKEANSLITAGLPKGVHAVA